VKKYLEMKLKNKILLVVTTYNQLEYTKLFIDSFNKLINKPDLLIIDDCSTDDTVEWCKGESINIITKDVGNGLTDSWNIGYDYFKKGGYDKFILANNDILIPSNSIEELSNVLDYWPCSLVVPMSTKLGAGHNQVQIIDNWWGSQPEYSSAEYYQEIQDRILNVKEEEFKSNNLYKFDPIRMKFFNGFFFMMSRNICKYERDDGKLFDPEFINIKNEDEFNWCNLIPNNDFAMLCKTSFVYHYKGVSFSKAGIPYSNDKVEFFNQR
jgi:GT2 family glycosyltransferase